MLSTIQNEITRWARTPLQTMNPKAQRIVVERCYRATTQRETIHCIAAWSPESNLCILFTQSLEPTAPWFGISSSHPNHYTILLALSAPKTIKICTKFRSYPSKIPHEEKRVITELATNNFGWNKPYQLKNFFLIVLLFLIFFGFL
jgi:hypothetical protein